MSYDLAVFLLKYDLIIIGVVLAGYLLLAMYVTYIEEKLHLESNSSPIAMSTNVLNNLDLVRKLINRYYIVLYILSMLIILCVKYFGPDKPMYLFEGILCEPTYIFASLISLLHAFLPVIIRVKVTSKVIRIIYKTNEVILPWIE